MAYSPTILAYSRCPCLPIKRYHQAIPRVCSLGCSVRLEALLNRRFLCNA
ncbi:hypothetical protein COLO4_19355 [Corchorus olitorius]|uniref:Uncharacterized protein n=1 Tax=Corchorus olitorius TaxID=93759 RepID=A0A1R3J5P2_9ROSI|nr:hypothetical protein COLO4_19355 [Corchorus olitorius]